MPFSDRLDGIAFPAGFKLPQFNLFDGNGDPLKHLKGFITHMTITSNNPYVYAKTFPNSLTGKALDWYMELPLKTLDSYQATADVFIAKFGMAIQTIQDVRILMDNRQNMNESLSSYHKRYKDLLLRIPTIDDMVAYMAFFNGLAYGKLKKVLLVKTPLSKDALTREVKQHIELEELMKKGGGSADLRETVLKKDRPRSPRKLPVWERIQRDWGENIAKASLFTTTSSARLGSL
ncbi:hypothetical protein LIER_32791 [Lithospermum erythrorhizon]|uniref:Retrotransposon gag domain-containing protein n=1 Tax=Lithospermum erythrorhizon TaxID=34254 RepID=A0AAV3RUU6_LITER